MTELILRSVYLRPSEDAQLRQLAHEINATKSDLIRAAVTIKLREWLADESNASVIGDVIEGRRDQGATRRGGPRKQPSAPEQMTPRSKSA